MIRKRLAVALGTLLLAAVAIALPAETDAGQTTPRVVFVAPDGRCSETHFLCESFDRALRRTGVSGKTYSPDIREDIVASVSLLAGQGYDLVIMIYDGSDTLATVAPRFPKVRFALFDGPFDLVRGRPTNVQGIVHQPREAAYLAGWLAARLEQRRPGKDVVGAVGGFPIPSVEDFIIGFRAGARRAAPKITVLTGYSNDFVDPTKCEGIARSQIARGAGTVFNVAGICGLGTLRAAQRSGVWGIGVDSDQSFLGPHVLTSVLKGYEAGFVTLLKQVRADTLRTGTTVLTLRTGGTRLGRISPKVPAPLRAELEQLRRRIVAGEVRVPGMPLA